MRASLTVLTEELRRLKASGLKTVVVPGESLDRLRAAVAGLARAAAPSAPAAPVASVSVEAGAATSNASAAPAARKRPPNPAPAPTAVAGPALPPTPTVVMPEGDKPTRWNWLRQHVVEHPVCREHVRPGKQVVFGVGNLDARIFFCGEAPGAEEEVQGEPFVGPAGELLTRMIGAMGLKRGDVYIGNIMNWRPQLPTAAGAEQMGNRPPTSDELRFCLPFLQAQLKIVQPRVVVALGATAAKGLLGEASFRALGEVRGSWHEFDGIPVRVTYHPSYILRNNTNRSKRAIWEDLLAVMERVEHPITERQRSYFL